MTRRTGGIGLMPELTLYVNQEVTVCKAKLKFLCARVLNQVGNN